MKQEGIAISIENEYPDVGDLVIATVVRVVDYGAYVRLDEYQGKEGMIHISEISTTWVKNIRDHAREGQKLVLKVLRVNPQRGQIDLSLRRVTGREKAEKMLQWKKEKKAESILKSASERIKIEPTSVEMIKQKVSEKYDSLYDALEDSVEGGVEVFVKLGIPSDSATALSEAAKSKIRLEKAKVKATVELTCVKPIGVDAIKTALLDAKKIRKPRGTDVKIYTVGSPRYRIEVTAKDYNDGERTLNEVVDEALATIKNLGGEGRRIG